MILEIDCTSDASTPFFDQVVTLDQAKYRLRFAWNTRGEHWTLSVETDDGESLVAGQVVNIGRDLLERSSSPRKPKGALIALGKSRSIELPGINELTSRVGLYFIEGLRPADEMIAELEQWLATALAAGDTAKAATYAARIDALKKALSDAARDAIKALDS